MIQVHKPAVWLLLAGAIILLLGVKTGLPLLSPAGPPLALGNQPALLFFNNDDGCECVVPLYQKADAVIAAWSPEPQARIPVHRFVLDERPDLQRHSDVERAPMLLLVDAGGREGWRQRGVASNPQVFDLAAVEARVRAAQQLVP